MSYPKYFVSYCRMNAKTSAPHSAANVNANIFGHALLLLSKQESEHGPIEVEDAFGFYSNKEHTTTHPIILSLKKLLGLCFNLQDIHGVLVQEPLHQIDLNGLEAITFPVNPDEHTSTAEKKYEELREDLAKKIADQDEAVKEINQQLQSKFVPQNSHTRLYEEASQANIEGRRARLQKFHITMEFNRYGPSTAKSYTCKQYALDFLKEKRIIDEKKQAKIAGPQAFFAFPRYCGDTILPIRIVSVPTSESVFKSKRANDKLYKDRDWSNHKLYLTLPPVEKLTSANLASYHAKNKVISDLISRATILEIQLQRKHNELFRSDSKYAKMLLDQRHRVATIYQLLSNASQNDSDACLMSHTLNANKILNVATMALHRHRVNSSFLFRFYESVAIRHCLLALLMVAFTVQFIPAALGTTLLITGATLFSLKNTYDFYKSEVDFAEKRKDYLDMYPQMDPERSTHRTLSPMPI